MIIPIRINCKFIHILFVRDIKLKELYLLDIQKLIARIRNIFHNTIIVLPYFLIEKMIHYIHYTLTFIVKLLNLTTIEYLRLVGQFNIYNFVVLFFNEFD